jgi:predicted DNA-binding transcriptional regulator AlpA
VDTNRETIYEYLKQKYKRVTIGKKEIAHELGVSASTVDLYISKGIGVPRYRKLGKSKNSKVVFNIADVAEFLTQNIIETM